VTRYLLETNIISTVTEPAPSEVLVAWMSEQAAENLFISSLTVAEILRGVPEKPAGVSQARRSTPAVRRPRFCANARGNSNLRHRDIAEQTERRTNNERRRTQPQFASPYNVVEPWPVSAAT